MNKIIINKDGKYFGEIFCDEKKRIVIEGTDKNTQVFLEKTLQKILKQGVKVRQEKMDKKNNVRKMYMIKVEPENPLYLLALAENLKGYKLTGIVMDEKRAILYILIKKSGLLEKDQRKLLPNLRNFSELIIDNLIVVFVENQEKLKISEPYEVKKKIDNLRIKSQNIY